MNRKNFLLLLSGTTVAACRHESLRPTATTPALVYLTADLATELLAVGDIKADQTRGAFVQRIALGNLPSSFLHFSLACTHAGCTVKYETALAEFHCPCHGSVFAGNGTVLNGPANKPLNKFVLTITNNLLQITDR